MPKNYSCDSSFTRKSLFTVTFAFGIRIVLKNGMVLAKNIPITIYREKLPEPAPIEGEEQDEAGQDD